MKLLKSARAWKGVYDKIIIISPTFMLQPIWKQISPSGVSVYLEFREEIIMDLMRQQTEDSTRKTLILLDDLGEDILHKAKSVFHKLIANSRHLNISVIHLCQKLTQSPTYCRSNTDCFISFASLATREREALFAEVSLVDKKSFAKMFAGATNEPYSTFCATFKNGKLRFYQNLEHELQ